MVYRLCLDQYRLIDNCPSNKIHWIFYQHANIFIKKNVLNVSSKMSGPLLRPQVYYWSDGGMSVIWWSLWQRWSLRSRTQSSMYLFTVQCRGVVLPTCRPHCFLYNIWHVHNNARRPLSSEWHLPGDAECCAYRTDNVRTESKIAHHDTLRPKQNGRHFADDILKCIFLREKIVFRL